MDTPISANRRKRLKEWFSERQYPEAEKSYLSQLVSGKASFGEKSARRLEKLLGMSQGHLDSGVADPMKNTKHRPRPLVQTTYDLAEKIDDTGLRELILFAECLVKSRPYKPQQRKQAA